MADLVVGTPGLTAAAPTANTGASGGDKFLNNGRTMMRLANTSGGAIVVTVAAQGSCSHGSTHNVTASVPATTGVRVLGPFPPSRFNINGGADHGKAAVTYDTNPPTGLTIELYGQAI